LIKLFNQKNQTKIRLISLNAGQHYDDRLSGLFVKEFKLNFDITISHRVKKPIDILCGMISGIANSLEDQSNPIDWVLVFGDSNPALAGSVAAAKREVPIIHVDAGSSLGEARTQEVLNARVIDQLSSVFFCRSKTGIQALQTSGINENVFWTGDIVRDFLSDFAQNIPESYGKYKPGEYVLASLHRQENLTSDDLITNYLNTLNNYGKKVLFLTHPRTYQKVNALGLLELSNIEYLPPLSYTQTISAMKGAHFIVTDSGGIPGEAYYLRKRCLLRFDMDYWPGLTEPGIHKIVGRSRHNLLDGLNWIDDKIQHEEYPNAPDLDNADGFEHAFREIIKITDDAR
jgi:UDP-N-acetylglucosamine 2-epimerase